MQVLTEHMNDTKLLQVVMANRYSITLLNLFPLKYCYYSSFFQILKTFIAQQEGVRVQE